MVAPAIIAAGIGAGADLFSSALSFFGQDKANKQAWKQAQAQMDFQRDMFKHRYQYTVNDMRKAGLNPILAYQQGGGSAPPGASSPVGNPGANLELGKSVATAIAVKRAAAELKNIEADTQLKSDTTWKVTAERGNLLQQYHVLEEQLKQASMATRAMELTLPSTVAADINSARARAAAAKLEENIDLSTSGELSRLIKRYSPLVPLGGQLIRK